MRFAAPALLCSAALLAACDNKGASESPTPNT